MNSQIRSVIRYFLFSINLIFLIIGIAVIVFEVCSLTKNDDLLSPFTTIILTFPDGIFACGILTTVITGYGCYGTIVNSYDVMLNFALWLFGLLLVDVYFLVALIEFPEYYLEKFHEFLLQATAIRGGTDVMVWDFIQSRLKCCGHTERSDWQGTIPASCCPKNVDKCSGDNIFGPTCDKKIDKWIEENTNNLLLFVFGLEVFKVLETILAFWYVYELRVKMETDEKDLENTRSNNAPIQTITSNVS